MQQALVTLLIPNFKTLDLTKLCLRLIRKHTDPKLIKVIVIDNDSRDASVTYLRTLSWITLIERPSIANEPGFVAHSKALDLGLAQVDTPYILSIHTDTLVKTLQWLPFLLNEIEGKPECAGVGSWKLEEKSPLQQVLKSIEEKVQLYYFNLRRKQHHIAGQGDNAFYLRSHCALYRTALLKKHHLHFSDGDQIAGRAIHKALVQHGYQLKFIPPHQLAKYIAHANHATAVLNPELTQASNKTQKKGLKRIQHLLKEFQANAILADDQLDK